MLQGTLVASTEAGSTYVLSVGESGVRWMRIPGRGALHGATTGWQPHLPAVIPGQRLMLGALRSTPVVEVAFLPAPDVSVSADLPTPHPADLPHPASPMQ